MFLLFSLATAAEFDHSHALWTKVLSEAVQVNGQVDYPKIASRSSDLQTYLNTIATADISSFSKDQRLAFFVNAYNANTVWSILQENPSSIRDIDDGKIWSTRTFAVAGTQMTLNEMEHNNARKLADGRVHSVVNCASVGCPPLPQVAINAATVEQQLNDSARRWTAVNAFVLDGDRLMLSKIFDWYNADFVSDVDLPNVEGKEEDALVFLLKFADEPTKEKLKSATSVGWGVYDWSLNGKK